MIGSKNETQSKKVTQVSRDDSLKPLYFDQNKHVLLKTHQQNHLPCPHEHNKYSPHSALHNSHSFSPRAELDHRAKFVQTGDSLPLATPVGTFCGRFFCVSVAVVVLQ